MSGGAFCLTFRQFISIIISPKLCLRISFQQLYFRLEISFDMFTGAVYEFHYALNTIVKKIFHIPTAVIGTCKNI